MNDSNPLAKATRSNLTRRTFLTASGVGAVAVALSLAGCQPKPAGPGEEGVRELFGARLGDFSTWDPWIVQDANRLMHSQLFDPLLIATSDTEFVGALATEWDFADDGMQLVFTLREGVTFHNGEPFNADAVLKNIERAMDASIGHNLAGPMAVIKEAKALSDYSVQIDFEQPAAPVPTLQVIAGMFIIAPAGLADVAREPIGTGPFSLESWKPSQEAVFARNDSYWADGEPVLDKVTLEVFSDPATMILSYQGGRTGFVTAPPDNRLKELSENGSSLLLPDVVSTFWCLAINVTETPFDNRLVRQALSHAIDRDSAAENAFFGFSKPVQTPFHDSSRTLYDPSRTNLYPYDLDRTKSLLEEAGVSNLSFECLNSTAYKQLSQVLVTLQQDLQSIGVDMQINELEGASWVERWVAGSFTVTASSSAIKLGDPVRTFAGIAPLRADEKNNCHWFDSEYQQTAKDAAAKLDQNDRLDLYGKLARQIETEAWVIPICTGPRHEAVKDSVDNVEYKGLDQLTSFSKTTVS